MLELRNLSKTYAGGRPVLSGLNWTFNAGEFVAIMGDSGVGKSTLLNLIAGLDTADAVPPAAGAHGAGGANGANGANGAAGPIIIDGVPLAGLDDDAATRLRRARMGFIFQAFHVLPHLTLLQNVALPLLLNGLPQQRASDMLDAVGLGGRGADFPHQLSGGQLQRVAIARALVHRPALVLADEPTGNLDPETAHAVMTLLRREIKATGACAIMVTHSLIAAQMTDKILQLSSCGLQETTFVQPFAQ